MKNSARRLTQPVQKTSWLKHCLNTAGSAFISVFSLAPNLNATAAEPQNYTLKLDGLSATIQTASDRLTKRFGPRFDRTAVISSVQVDGTELLGPWGLSDEFGLHGNGVLGFENASIGESFTKIGVGELIKDVENDYDFSHNYPIKELFPIGVSHSDTSLTVIQTAPNSSDWPYHYSKTYTLLPNGRIKIEYALTNLGQSAWTFEHYNHHWFRLEGKPIGTGYSVNTAFPLPESPTGLIKEKHSLAMPGPLAPSEAQYYASDLMNVPADENRFEVRANQEPIIRFQGSTSADRFALYADPDGFCPEVFTRQTIAPQQTIRWQSLYQFSAP